MHHAHKPATGGSILLPLPRLSRGPRREPEAPRDADGALRMEEVSSLLWNGLGFSRHVHGRAALPSRLRSELQVYAILPEGAYRYDAEEHRLDLVTPSDLRACIDGAGTRAAALHLLYVTADATRGEEEWEWEECGRLAVQDVATMAQHVAGHCAERGFVASTTNRVAPRARAALRLHPGQRVALAQRIQRPAQATC